MQKIKIFLASSAEIDEDKTQIDLYFSQKNKIYNNRYIYFEQKTWKDFPSYLDENRLQNRYNDYIRQCDIVIFLFHEKIGKYTLEELQVAFEQVIKSKGKKPKIYIYVKNHQSGQDILEFLKQYSESTYGHFCDTYSDYDSLFRHLDYQLEQLENSGFLKPNPIDLKRVLRFVLLGLLPLLATIMILVIYTMTRSGKMVVDLCEQVNNSLPFKSGVVVLDYDGIRKEHTVNSPDERVVFEGIGKWDCWTKEFELKFQAEEFNQIDTLISFHKHVCLPIMRNGHYGVIKGMVLDEERNPVEGASIMVMGHAAVSSENGCFQIEIPLEKQRTDYRITVKKNGFKIWDYNNIPPSVHDEMRIVLKK